MVWEHIVIVEEKLGRHLVWKGTYHPESEIVHHINEKKDDNRPENLRVTTNREHKSLHKRPGRPEKFRTWPWLLFKITRGLLEISPEQAASALQCSVENLTKKESGELPWTEEEQAAFQNLARPIWKARFATDNFGVGCRLNEIRSSGIRKPELKRDMRIKCGLSIRAVAKEMKISHVHLSLMEKGQREFNAKQQAAFDAALVKLGPKREAAISKPERKKK